MDKSKGLKCDVTDFLRNGENYLDVLVEKGMLSQEDASEYLRLTRQRDRPFASNQFLCHAKRSPSFEKERY